MDITLRPPMNRVLIVLIVLINLMTLDCYPSHPSDGGTPLHPPHG